MRKETDKNGKRVTIELSFTNPVKQVRQTWKHWRSNCKHKDHHKINFLIGSIEWGRFDGKREKEGK